MASVLTEHVRHFGTSSDPAEQVLPAIKRLLQNRMRQRNLLSARPELLGYSGVSSWGAEGAFEDIVADCYIFAIAQRIEALQKQLKIKPNVDGLISRNVNNFLLERQQRHDPLGYAVYGNVKGAAFDGVAANVLVLENLDRGKVANETVLGFVDVPRGTPMPPEAIRDALHGAAGWEEAVRHLTETTGEGREWILGFVRELRASGASAIRCGDLITAVATRLRQEWTVRHAEPAADLAREGDEEYGATVRMVWPDESVESRERWERLKRLIPDSIARLDRQNRVRDRLAGVFAALVRAVESGGHEPPTQAELTEMTGVPRATLSDDFRLLRDIVSGIEGQDSDT